MNAITFICLTGDMADCRRGKCIRDHNGADGQASFPATRDLARPGPGNSPDPPPHGRANTSEVRLPGSTRAMRQPSHRHHQADSALPRPTTSATPTNWRGTPPDRVCVRNPFRLSARNGSAAKSVRLHLHASTSDRPRADSRGFAGVPAACACDCDLLLLTQCRIAGW